MYRIGEKISKIEDILGEDLVGRGIDVLREKIPSDELFQAAKSLLEADEVYIVTGFFIPSCKVIETDGLSGAAFLAKTAVSLGKKVFVLYDFHNKEIFQEGLCAINCCVSSVFPKLTMSPKTWISPKGKAILIAVERPGRGKDGKYKTRKGIEIPAYPLDDLFIEAIHHKKLVKTISCADGLNEVGMGKLPRGIIPQDEDIQSVVPVDYLVVSGTADWAAYGLITLVSLLTGKDLLPVLQEQKTFLKAIVSAGAVDGITGKKELSVDSLPMEKQWEKVQALRSIL